jgi:hypothetical protein
MQTASSRPQGRAMNKAPYHHSGLAAIFALAYAAGDRVYAWRKEEVIPGFRDRLFYHLHFFDEDDFQRPLVNTGA